MATRQDNRRPQGRPGGQGQQGPDAAALAVPERPRPPIQIGPRAELASPEALGRAAEMVLGRGDLASMTPPQRARYLLYVCQLVGLNPFTRPFEIIAFQNATVLYARKEATEQLARNYGVSTEVRRAERDEFMGLYVVEVRASCAWNGATRTADATGAVPYVDGGGRLLPVAERANVVKKAETQARRRAVLGLLGLGIFDRAGERDPDLMTDGHGNVAGRGAARELPASSATAADIFEDEPPDTYRGGPAARGGAILTPTDEELAAAADAVAAEDGGGPDVRVVVDAGGTVRATVGYDGRALEVRAGGRMATLPAVGLSEATAGALGTVVARWLSLSGAALPEAPGADAGESAWSSWHDAVLDLLDRGASGG